MSTVEVGNKFENRMYEWLSTEIESDRFYFKKELCRIYKKKGYYSNDRKKDIIFDIAIEVFMPNADHFSHLVLIECKNYNHSVPVDDVEEFFQKTQQISGANLKAIVASTNSFQSGTVNFARSKGVGLCRYYDPSKLEFVLHRSPSGIVNSDLAFNENSSAYRAIRLEEFRSIYFDFYGYINDINTASSLSFFEKIILKGLDASQKEKVRKYRNTGKNDASVVPYVEISDIEKRAFGLLESIEYESGAVAETDLSEFISAKYKFSVGCDVEIGNEGLGSIDFQNRRICVDDKECGSKERIRFTLAHEFGHLVLDHYKYMSGEILREYNLSDDAGAGIGIADFKRLEWQANQFASLLLMPTKSFLNDFVAALEMFEIPNIGFGALYLDGQPCNQDNFYRVSSLLKNRYQVSQQAIKIRLKSLGLLKERSGAWGA